VLRRLSRWLSGPDSLLTSNRFDLLWLLSLPTCFNLLLHKLHNLLRIRPLPMTQLTKQRLSSKHNLKSPNSWELLPPNPFVPSSFTIVEELVLHIQRNCIWLDNNLWQSHKQFVLHLVVVFHVLLFFVACSPGMGLASNSKLDVALIIHFSNLNSGRRSLS
jgi:hypothetical protein